MIIEYIRMHALRSEFGLPLLISFPNSMKEVFKAINDPEKIRISNIIMGFLIVSKASLGKTATKTSWDFRN